MRTVESVGATVSTLARHGEARLVPRSPQIRLIRISSGDRHFPGQSFSLSCGSAVGQCIFYRDADLITAWHKEPIRL